MENNRYGFGKNPPYTLYQGPDGLWGLIDSSGNKLEAVFKRGDNDSDSFSCVPWEVVTFDPQQGFELQAWFDPDEVWFNFIFNNPAYPAEYQHYLWEKAESTFDGIFDTIKILIPKESHWLIEVMLLVDKEEEMEDDAFDQALKNTLTAHPELNEPSVLNPIIYPIIENTIIDDDIKRKVWQTKIGLDYVIQNLNEDNE